MRRRRGQPITQWVLKLLTSPHREPEAPRKRTTERQKKSSAKVSGGLSSATSGVQRKGHSLQKARAQKTCSRRRLVLLRTSKTSDLKRRRRAMVTETSSMLMSIVLITTQKIGTMKAATQRTFSRTPKSTCLSVCTPSRPLSRPVTAK